MFWGSFRLDRTPWSSNCKSILLQKISRSSHLNNSCIISGCWIWKFHKALLSLKSVLCMDSVLQEALPRQICRKQPFAVTLQMMNERRERLNAFHLIFCRLSKSKIFCRASTELLLFDSLCNTWAPSSSCSCIYFNEITINGTMTELQSSPALKVTRRWMQWPRFGAPSLLSILASA